MIKSLKKDEGTKIFIYLIFIHFITFQMLSILRATAIYNTSTLAVYSSLVISLIMLFFFLSKLKSVKFNFFELLLLLIPIIYCILGVAVNNSYRDLLADTYNALFFVIVIVYMRSQKINFDQNLQVKFANWMFICLLISTATYWITPLLGINIYSVGGTSIFFVFPLIVFLINKRRLKFLIILLLLVLASKRGVLLGVMSILLFMGLGNKNIKPAVRAIIVVSVVMAFTSIMYITLSPDKIMNTPQELHPLLYKTMYVNPISDFNTIESDARVREVVSSMKSLIEHPVYLITGMGPGYTYDFLDQNGNLLQEERHNVHVTPVSIYTKYGIIYLIGIYTYIISVIVINYKKLKRRELSTENTVLLFYLIAGLVNSLTSYTIYLDYLFIIALGILSFNIKNISGKHIK